MTTNYSIEKKIVVSSSGVISKGREIRVVITGTPDNLALSISGTVGQGSILLPYNDIEVLRKLLIESEYALKEAIYDFNGIERGN